MVFKLFYKHKFDWHDSPKDVSHPRPFAHDSLKSLYLARKFY